jgi:UDP-N-acetylglucosamine/UDP-N-acetylgalactosamine diphosphorylase
MTNAPAIGPSHALFARLKQAGQEHLLTFYPSLSEAQRRALETALDAIDFERLPRLIKEYVTSAPSAHVPNDLQPAPYYPLNTRARNWDRARFRAIGEELLRKGQVAAFTVAGGQGSRLGYEGPKGCYPASPVTNKPLFQVFAENLRAAAKKFGKPVPWYIMTSPLNHGATLRFFEEHSYFGLPEDDVMFFPQGVMPSFEMGTGRILLAAKHEPATNPDGHGGALKALFTSGAIDEMRDRGVEHISYFQVDNPLVKIVDPTFLGLHAGAPDSSGEMSSKMVTKANAEEKVGVFCSWNDERTPDGPRRTGIIEYSDMPAALVKQTNADGSLRFNAGSIAVHALSVDFVAKLNTDTNFDLPYHRAEKKVPFVDLKSGQIVNPEKPNGVKLERFVFDALPLCASSIVFETDRGEEFAPIKNATGVDSVESSKRLQSDRAARWLESAGISVPRKPDGSLDATIELSPLSALEGEDVGSIHPRPAITRGASIAL